MKIYTIMYNLDVKSGNYDKDFFVTKDKEGNLCIGPEVFSTREEAEEWIALNPEHIREDYTIVELGFKSIKDYKH